jgi:hypothetical protein
MFFPSGFEHSTSHTGGAWARNPWEAVQKAAGDALYKNDHQLTLLLAASSWTSAMRRQPSPHREG